ncbi:type III PLP-dependent enzyme [Hirschia baltica]|uniref:Orn/DAP/Arg decarboxylase 2 n=1 Tax=Hirschia baltica (strain ATCC 49814 / DSM 5838 / IFAM 1418) TaxID=582402 RepID=C6XQ02_HIRBI|nr:type III PLP-dependent enzyme [Hirschia baltica]ACT58519.1 Orn/DAP/Arg decarboxylase 2 [Hirschia baltica ATCC 49814]
MITFQTPLDLVRVLHPESPVACVRPERVSTAAAWFQNHFPGDVLYAVKANPSPWALDAMYEAGMRWFDVASLEEIELVANRFDDAVLAYMHPIKSRNSIERAYFDYGVRIFVLDCEAELQKILEATDFAKDLTLVVRMAVSNDGASMPLSGKFGCFGDDAAHLLQAARSYADELGVSFHVGSQCMDPGAYRIAMDTVSNTIVQAAVTVDIVDVGGGFPALYPGMQPPELQSYIDVINQVFEEMPVLFNADLWCEPGRALVADSTSIVAKVELVRDGRVYLNDGAYGNLFDAAHCKWPFPMEVHRVSGKTSIHSKPFTIYGPTCDSIDVLDGVFDLPADIQEGDYIEFGMMGAYGTAMSTRFNGFGDTKTYRVRNSISQTMYETQAEEQRRYENNVIFLPRREA